VCKIFKWTTFSFIPGPKYFMVIDGKNSCCI
jgi:hypothetical protein